MKKLQALRGFCIGDGADALPGEIIDPHRVGEGRAAILCSGSNPKCKWVEEDSAGDEAPADGDAPGTDDDAGPSENPRKAEKKRVPEKLRRR